MPLRALFSSFTCLKSRFSDDDDMAHLIVAMLFLQTVICRDL